MLLYSMSALDSSAAVGVSLLRFFSLLGGRMFISLRRFFVSLFVVAISMLALVLGPSDGDRIHAEGDAFAEFKAKWDALAGDQLNAHARKQLLQTLAIDDPNVVPALALGLEDRHWLVRLDSLLRILRLTDPATRDAWLRVLKSPRTPDKVKENIAYGFAWQMQPPTDHPAFIRDLLKENFEAKTPHFSCGVAEVLALKLQDHIGGAPPVVPPGASEEEKREIEGKAKEISANKQPVLKAHAQVLLQVFETLMDPKRNRTLKKDPDYAKLRWTTVNSLECITGQEFGMDIKAWQKWMNKDHVDAESGELKDLEPLYIRMQQEQYGDVTSISISFGRASRKNNTGIELYALIPNNRTISFYSPYLMGLSEYFDLVLIPSIDTSAGSKEAKDDQGNSIPGGYQLDFGKLAAAIDARRKMKGAKCIGLFTTGPDASIALEYAKAYPNQCAFVVCNSPSVNGKDQLNAINKMKESTERLDFKYCAMINRMSYRGDPPEEFTQEKRTLGDNGEYAHLYGDEFDTQIVAKFIDYFRARNNQASQSQPMLPQKAMDYEFSVGAASDIPAMLVWGEHDPFYSKDVEARLTEQLAACQSFRMKGAGYLSWTEQPSEFFANFEKFLKAEKIEKRIKDLTSTR
ncbi:MAG: alpha/beta hydrolase [Planctomycetes bacterium]|nr:alpha/beta hydrolase [Planctomycetota bacterium]